jgi:hypothetical protein
MAAVKRWGLIALGVFSVVVGGISTLWLIGMVHQWLIPWSSLAILAPPHH